MAGPCYIYYRVHVRPVTYPSYWDPLGPCAKKREQHNHSPPISIIIGVEIDVVAPQQDVADPDGLPHLLTGDVWEVVPDGVHVHPAELVGWVADGVGPDHVPGAPAAGDQV